MATITYDPTRPFPSLEVLYKFKLLNTSDKTILGLKVMFPPNASTPPHKHAGAFAAVHVLAGSVYNAMNDGDITIKKAGESFYEAPGCWHRVSDNASATEEAILIVSFVIETEVLDKLMAESGIAGIVVVDEAYKEAVGQQIERMQKLNQS